MLVLFIFNSFYYYQCYQTIVNNDFLKCLFFLFLLVIIFIKLWYYYWCISIVKNWMISDCAYQTPLPHGLCGELLVGGVSRVDRRLSSVAWGRRRAAVIAAVGALVLHHLLVDQLLPLLHCMLTLVYTVVIWPWCWL